MNTNRTTVLNWLLKNRPIHPDNDVNSLIRLYKDLLLSREGVTAVPRRVAKVTDVRKRVTFMLNNTDPKFLSSSTYVHHAYYKTLFNNENWKLGVKLTVIELPYSFWSSRDFKKLLEKLKESLLFEPPPDDMRDLAVAVRCVYAYAF